MRTLVTVTLMGLLTSCVRIQSNTKSEAVPAFKRILVVTKMRDTPDSYAQSFSRAFPTGYSVCTLALSPLSFDKPEEEIRKKAESCQSDVILTLTLTQSGVSTRYYAVPYEFNAEMTSVATEQPFWKAIISSAPINGERVSPRSVVKRLLNDGIIEGKLPDQSLQAINGQNVYR